MFHFSQVPLSSDKKSNFQDKMKYGVIKISRTLMDLELILEHHENETIDFYEKFSNFKKFLMNKECALHILFCSKFKRS
jgi:hypothetical protein